MPDFVNVTNQNGELDCEFFYADLSSQSRVLTASNTCSHRIKLDTVLWLKESGVRFSSDISLKERIMYET